MITCRNSSTMEIVQGDLCPFGKATRCFTFPVRGHFVVIEFTHSMQITIC